MSVDDDDDGDGDDDPKSTNHVVSAEYQCDGDGDGDDAKDGDDDPKSTNLVVSEEMVQYNKICCFIDFLVSCDGDGDSEDDAKICWFLAYKIHKSCCL